MPTSGIDILCWAFAGLLGLVGVVQLAWALFWDRARGRRRCPNCWYEMAGVEGRRCPECGREQRSERRMFKTRRSWRMAAVGVVLMLGGNMAWSVPDVRSRGWWAAVPRPALALMIGSVREESDGVNSPMIGSLELEIRWRYFAGSNQLRRLWPGEGLLLRFAARRALGPGHGERAERLAAELWAPQINSLPVGLTPHGRALMAISLSQLVYARCTSYRDTGLVKGADANGDEIPFMTVFERSGPLRFEIVLAYKVERSPNRYVVWGKEPDIKSWWAVNNQTRMFEQRATAMTGSGSLSAGAATRVPSLLDGEPALELSLLMSDAAVSREERFDGRPCLVIRGTRFSDTSIEVWLDAESLLIRKVCWRGQFNWTTVYRPELNPAIDPSWFEFDPAKPDQSLLGDGEESCRELRGLAGER